MYKMEFLDTLIWANAPVAAPEARAADAFALKKRGSGVFQYVNL